MWKLISKSIVRRFNTVILSVISLSLLFFTLIIATFNYNQTISDLNQDAEGTVELASIALEGPLWNIDDESIKAVAKAIMMDKNIVAIKVTDKKATFYEEKRNYQNSPNFDDFNTHAGFLYSKGEIKKKNETIGFVHILTSKRKAFELIIRTSVGIIVFALLLIVFMGFTVWYTATKLIKAPIHKLKESAQFFSQGELEGDIDVSREDELGSLANSFSAMRDSIRIKIDDLYTLNSTGDLLAGIHDETEAMKMAMGVINERFKLESGFAFLVDKETDLHFKTSHSGNDNAEYSLEIQKLGKQFSAKLADEKELVFSAVGSLGISEKMEPLMFVPMLDEQALFGIMVFSGCKEVIFEKEDKRFILTIAQMTTLALKNIQMFNLIEEQNRTLEQKVSNRTALLEEGSLELQRMNEDLKKAKEDADFANQAKSDFLANMAHEIRTPMNAVLGFTEILKNKIKDPQLFHYLETIHTSGKALLKLINDILDLSKVEAGKLKIEYTSVSLHEIIEEIKTLFDQKVRGKELDFLVEVQQGMPQTLCLDETRVRQVLLNLVGNALKFTDSGYIKLSARFSFPDEMNHSIIDLEMVVEDTGMGIPSDQTEKIFEAFEQHKHGRSGKLLGTGLGLTITRRLVSMMNGEISLESEQGKGSSFRVLLKVVEVPPDGVLDVKHKPHFNFDAIRFKGSTVLIADDIEYNRELLKGFLEGHDLNLIEAENGKEVLDIVQRYKPDLILLDMKMDVMDGYETAKILSKDENLKDIPVIAVTASALVNDEEVISRICAGYVRKPVSYSDLISALLNFLPYMEMDVPEVEKPEAIHSRKSNVLTEDIPEKFPELLKIMMQQQLRCRELIKVMSIDGIEQFALDMKALGQTHKFEPLISWADELYSATLAFDIDKIVKYLQDF